MYRSADLHCKYSVLLNCLLIVPGYSVEHIYTTEKRVKRLELLRSTTFNQC